MISKNIYNVNIQFSLKKNSTPNSIQNKALKWNNIRISLCIYEAKWIWNQIICLYFGSKLAFLHNKKIKILILSLTLILYSLFYYKPYNKYIAIFTCCKINHYRSMQKNVRKIIWKEGKNKKQKHKTQIIA